MKGADKTPIRAQLLSAGAWTFTGKIAAGLIVVAMSAFLARVLPPAEFGAYILAFSVASIAALVGRMGLEFAALRLLAEAHAAHNHPRMRHLVSSISLLALAGLVTVAAAIYLGLGRWLADTVFQSGELAAIMPWLPAWLVLLGVQLLFAEYFRGVRRFPLASLFTGTAYGGLLSSTLALVLVFLAWRAQGGLTVDVAASMTVYATAVTVLLGVLVLFKWVSTDWRREAPQEVSRNSPASLLGIGFPLLVSSIGLLLFMHADLWILGALRPEEDVALYGSASRLVKVIAMSLIVSNEVLAPFIAQFHVEKDTQRLQHILRVTAAFVSLPALLVLLLFAFAGSDILELLYGDYFGAAGSILAILSVGQLINTWTGSSGYTLIMTGHGKVSMVSSTVSASLLVVGGLLAVPKYGTQGMAVVFALAMLVQQAILLLAARYYVGIWTHASPVLAFRYVKQRLGRSG